MASVRLTGTSPSPFFSAAIQFSSRTFLILRASLSTASSQLICCHLSLPGARYSGVFTRSRITGESPKTGPDIEGMQVEVDPTRHTGGIYESGGRGWVALPTPEGERAIKPRDWNELEVRAEGRHIVTRLNGVQIVDYNDPTLRFTEGVIGLQLHTGGGVKVRFKDISIRDLSK